MRCTTKTGENQKISRRVEEDSVEANKTIRHSLKSFSMMN